MTASRIVRIGNTITIASQSLTCQAPSTTLVAAGVTSGSIVWNSASGGLPPYNYGSVSVSYDTLGESTTAILTTAGGSPGTSTLTSLVNGQTITLTRTVTDSEGTSLDVQAVISVAATAATITAGAAPANQVLAAGTTSATIGTWGAPTGGTGPYTYAVTESTGGSTVTGTGLGVWSVSGLTDGATYAFVLAITDSLGAKGYSVVTISVKSSSSASDWEEIDSTDFEDSDWFPLSSADVTQSTTAWQHTLYAADGVTARAYIYNNSSAARTLSLSPSDVGLKLVNGSAAAQPQIGVWPAGWASMIGGSRKDVWLIEAIVGGEEPSGTTAFVHIFTISTNSSTPAINAPATGLRNINSSSGIRIGAASYASGFAEQAIQTLTSTPTRAYVCRVQVTIADSRRHDIYVSPNATDFSTPLSGQRVRAQSASTAMTAPGGEVATSASWFASSVAGRTKFGLYHDGTATTGSYIVLKKLRLLRKVNGSF